MAKIITVANQKGGVAKTVTCQHLAYALIKHGRKVLTIDFDPQINLTATLATNVDTLPPLSISDLFNSLLVDEALPDTAQYIASRGGIDFIPGSKELSRQESVLQTEMGTERFLQNILDPLRNDYFPECALSRSTLSGFMSGSAYRTWWKASDKTAFLCH